MNRRDQLALWLLVAIVSPASEYLVHLVAGTVPGWLLWARILVLVAVIAFGVFARWLRFLSAFCFAYLYQLFGMALRDVATASGAYHTTASRHGFIGGMLFLDAVALVYLAPAIIWCLGRRERFYLRVGNLTATVEPLKQTHDFARVPWRVVAPVFAVGGALTAWAFINYTGHSVRTPLTTVPWAILFAAFNSLHEEFMTRNLVIGTLEPHFGARQAILVSAFTFGIGHWNGLPAGALGVLMTFALGWMAGKAMVDTKGMFWSWLMHVLPDCVLIYYWSVGSVAHATIGSVQ